MIMMKPRRQNKRPNRSRTAHASDSRGKRSYVIPKICFAAGAILFVTGAIILALSAIGEIHIGRGKLTGILILAAAVVILFVGMVMCMCRRAEESAAAVTNSPSPGPTELQTVTGRTAQSRDYNNDRFDERPPTVSDRSNEKNMRSDTAPNGGPRTGVAMAREGQRPFQNIQNGRWDPGITPEINISYDDTPIPDNDMEAIAIDFDDVTKRSPVVPPLDLSDVTPSPFYSRKEFDNVAYVDTEDDFKNDIGLKEIRLDRADVHAFPSRDAETNNLALSTKLNATSVGLDMNNIIGYNDTGGSLNAGDTHLSSETSLSTNDDKQETGLDGNTPTHQANTMSVSHQNDGGVTMET